MTYSKSTLRNLRLFCFKSFSDIYTPFQKTTELKTAGMVRQWNLSKRHYMTRFTFFTICDSFYKNAQDRHMDRTEIIKKRDWNGDISVWILLQLQAGH